MPAARKGGPSALVIFGGAMAAGATLVAGAALILTGDGPRRSRGGSTQDHASVAVPRRQSTPPAPAADAPPETTDVAAPTPPPSPQEAPPAPAAAGPAAADAPPDALAFAPAARDKKAEEELFAKLHRESKERTAREAEARAAQEATARAAREARERAAREAKARADREARERAAREAEAAAARGARTTSVKTIIGKNARWNYLAGAHPRGNWTRHDYRPLAQLGWRGGTAGFGYGDNDDRTVLKHMQHKYTVVYIRRPFRVADPADFKELVLVVNYDDGFIAYLNGREAVRAGVATGRGARASGVVLHEAGKFERFKIKEPGRFLRKGTNVLAIEGHNVHDRSSDLTLDPYLEGLIETASP